MSISVSSILGGIVFAGTLSFRGYAKGSLSPSGTAAAFITGFLTLTLGGIVPAADLVAFFLSSSLLTKVGAETKRVREADYDRSSSRTAVQVLANSASATAILTAAFLLPSPLLAHIAPLAVLSHYAACCADTWASELGILVSSPPRLITSPWRSVPPGTNGGVTLAGTAAAASGGAFIGLIHALASFVAVATSSSSSNVDGEMGPGFAFYIVLGTTAGLIGTTVDSVLGATLQYSGWDREKRIVVEHPGPNVKHIVGFNLLDNHQVNALASLLSLFLSVYLAHTLFFHS